MSRTTALVAGSAEFAVLARDRKPALTFHSTRLIAGAHQVGIDVHGASHASGSTDVCGFVVFPDNCTFQWNGQTAVTYWFNDARTVSSRRRITGRAMQLVSGHESFCHTATVGLSQFLMQVSSSRVSLIWFQDSLCKQCVWNEGHLGRNPMSSPQ